MFSERSLKIKKLMQAKYINLVDFVAGVTDGVTDLQKHSRRYYVFEKMPISRKKPTWGRAEPDSDVPDHVAPC